MFYPHTIKGKVNHRLDLISIPPIPPIPTPPTVPASTALLNATNHSFRAPDDPSFNWGALGFTAVAYIKLDAGFSSTGCIMSKWGEAPWREFNLLILSDRTVRLQYNQNGQNNYVTLTGTQVLNTDQWYTVAMTVSGNNTSLGSRKHSIVIDGVEDASALNDWLVFSNGHDLRIGAHEAVNSSPTYHFDGSIGFAGIWGRELSTTGLSDLTNSGDALCYGELETKSPGITSNLISYYHLATFTGHGSDALTDQHGSNDLINVNSTPFTGTGLSVEC